MTTPARSLGLICLLALSCTPRVEGPGEDRSEALDVQRPNIVFFLMDDLDFDEIDTYDDDAFPSYTGAKRRGLFSEDVNPWLGYVGELHTPHIDSLAAEGVRFTRFYVTSSVCTPSRYSFITGRYASRSPLFQQVYPVSGQANLMWNTALDPDEMNLAKLLRAGGYRTGIVGKWHNTEWSGPYAGQIEDLDPASDPRDPEVARKVTEAYERGVEHLKQSHGFDFVERIYLQNKENLGIPKALQVHNWEWIIEGALEFIEQKRDQPFFLLISSSAPHGWLGSAAIATADPLATPAGMLDARPRGMPKRSDAIARARAAGASTRRTEATWLDDGVGAVLDKLESLKIADDTIVLFVSDHQNRGKNTNYEAARVPAMIRWPGRIRAGIDVDEIVANIDVMPTLLDAAGVDIPEGMTVDGQSLLPLLEAEGFPSAIRESVMLEIGYSRAVVSKRWKYIALRYPEHLRERVAAAPNTFGWDGTQRTFEQDTKWDAKGDTHIWYGSNQHFPAYFDADQLYDLEVDVYEQHNLARSEDHADALALMQDQLRQHSRELPHSFGEFRQ